MLWDAVVLNDVHLAKKLRKQGASVNIKQPDSDNMVGSVTWTRNTGHWPSLCILCQQFDLANLQGCSILAQACRHGSLEMVQFLLRCGAKAKVCVC